MEEQSRILIAVNVEESRHEGKKEWVREKRGALPLKGVARLEVERRDCQMKYQMKKNNDLSLKDVEWRGQEVEGAVRWSCLIVVIHIEAETSLALNSLMMISHARGYVPVCHLFPRTQYFLVEP